MWHCFVMGQFCCLNGTYNMCILALNKELTLAKPENFSLVQIESIYRRPNRHS